MPKIRYASRHLVYLYDINDLKTKKKQLLWGDWLRIEDDLDAKWSKIKWGPNTYAIKKEDYQEERLLETIFLDVGQGDGCILTTPMMGAKEKVMIIDAGIGDNMEGFLNYRFRDFKKKFKFHAAVVTHPDSDHYRGFQKIFENPQISFENVYHNGLLERTGDNLLGKVEKGFVTEIYPSKTKAKALYSDASKRGRKYYPQLIWTALKSDRFKNISMLSTTHGAKEEGKTWLPGFAPSDNPEFTIEILGPVVEKAPNGKRGLRVFGKTLRSRSMDKGKTKNGHSILLRLQYRNFSMLFGGDLNTPAEQFLMRHYGNNGDAPSTLAETEKMIRQAKERFAVDLMKCCHHGSSDVTDEFLEATEAAAFVVSSGDEESHVHPRPDLLGLLGKKGRGQRPLVLCTEVLRSTREAEDAKDRGRLDRLLKKIEKESDPQKKSALKADRSKILDRVFKRNVGVYGAINVRTDGRKVVIAFRNEKSKGVKRWFTYDFEKNSKGVFVLAGTNGR